MDGSDIGEELGAVHASFRLNIDTEYYMHAQNLSHLSKYCPIPKTFLFLLLLYSYSLLFLLSPRNETLHNPHRSIFVTPAKHVRVLFHFPIGFFKAEDESSRFSRKVQS